LVWDWLWEVARQQALLQAQPALVALANPGTAEQLNCPDYTDSEWVEGRDERWFEGEWVMQRRHYTRSRTNTCDGSSETQQKTEGPFRLWQAVPDLRIEDVNRPQGSTDGLSGSPLRSSELPLGLRVPEVGPSPEAVVPDTKPSKPKPADPPSPWSFTGVSLLVGVLVHLFVTRRTWRLWEPVPATGTPAPVGGEEAEVAVEYQPGPAPAAYRYVEDREEIKPTEYPSGEEKLRRRGFTDLAIRFHGVEALKAIMDHQDEKGTSPEAQANVVKELNVWAENVASGQAERDEKVVNGSSSLLVGMIPGVGEVKDAQESLTGVDYITGEKLATWERVVTAGAFFVPLVGGKAVRGALKGGGKAAGELLRHGDEVAEAAEQVARHGDEVIESTGEAAVRLEEAGDAVVGSSKQGQEAVSSAAQAGVESSRAKRIDYSANFEGDLDNFLPGYRLVDGVLDEDLVLVQFHSNTALGDQRSAKWWTTTAQANQFATLDDVHQSLALPPEWGDRTTVSVARIPKGTHVTFYVGQAIKQVDKLGNEFGGGGVQFRFKDFDPSWIAETREMR